MNKTETIEAIKVMQAYVDGEDIQYNGEFKSSPVWNWTNGGSYKVKPVPIEIWCMANSAGHCLSNQPSEDDCIETIADLNRQHNNDFEDYKAVLFRQVLDD